MLRADADRKGRCRRAAARRCARRTCCDAMMTVCPCSEDFRACKREQEVVIISARAGARGSRLKRLSGRRHGAPVPRLAAAARQHGRGCRLWCRYGCVRGHPACTLPSTHRFAAMLTHAARRHRARADRSRPPHGNQHADGGRRSGPAARQPVALARGMAGPSLGSGPQARAIHTALAHAGAATARRGERGAAASAPPSTSAPPTLMSRPCALSPLCAAVSRAAAWDLWWWPQSSSAYSKA